MQLEYPTTPANRAAGFIVVSSIFPFQFKGINLYTFIMIVTYFVSDIYNTLLIKATFFISAVVAAWLVKAWTAIDRQSVILRSHLSDKIKCNFFQAAVVPILLYRCAIWTLTKRIEKKLVGNCTEILRAVLNKSWKQHPTKQQLYSHQPPISKTFQA